VTNTHQARARHLRARIDQLAARRAERASGAAGAFALDAAQLDALRAQRWWRDDYEAFGPSIALLSRLVLEDGRTWGEVAEDLQWEDALAILTPHSATPYHFLTRARGRSKTTDLAAIVLVVMLTQARPGDQLYALAADKAQGGLLVDSIRGFVTRTPALANVARVNRYTVVTPAGVEFEALAADASGAWGLRPAFLVVDEIAWWAETPTTEKLWEATYTAMHKVPGSRLVVLTTAGDPAHFSHGLRERAATSDLWRLHEVPGPPPWADQARLDEERDALPDASWRRLFLNEWTAGNDRLTKLDDVRACLRDHDQPLPPHANTRYVIGVDLGLTHDPAVAVVAHLEPDTYWNETGGLPTVVVDRIERWHGSHEQPVDLDTVESWLHDTAHGYSRAHIVMDSWQGAGMAQRLRNQHLKVTDINFTAELNDHLARTLLPLLRGQRLSLPHDPVLVDELVNVRVIEPRPGKYKIEHDTIRHNDQTIAIALAAQHLLNAKPRARSRVVV
jgi:phage terminase large subunit-like protein